MTQLQITTRWLGYLKFLWTKISGIIIRDIPKLRFTIYAFILGETLIMVENGLLPIILCFDIDTETFRYMKNIVFGRLRITDSQSLKTLLTLIIYPNPKWQVDEGQEFTNIWIMQQYGVNDTWMNK